YRAQGAEQTLAMRRTVVDATALSVDLSERQHRAGNVPDLVFANDRATYEQARVDLARAESEAAEDREELTALLGLWGSATDWRSAPRLPELPGDDAVPDDPETLAVSQRLDLAAARQRVHEVLLSRDLTQLYRFLSTASLGLAVDREVDDGAWSIGPAF